MTKKTSQKSAGRGRDLRIFGLVAVGTAVFLGAAAFALNRNSDSDSDTTSTPAQTDQLVTADAQQITSPDATVTIVEFLDLECEACAAAHPIVKQILADYEGRVNYVVRNFPNHNNSILAARAAEAAGEQGKYFEMSDKLFTGQRSWGEQSEPQTEVFLGYARELGLDMEQFTTSLGSGLYDDKFAADKAQARALGVDATPTFFINGEKVVGVMSYNQFSERLDSAIAAAAAN